MLYYDCTTNTESLRVWESNLTEWPYNPFGFLFIEIMSEMTMISFEKTRIIPAEKAHTARLPSHSRTDWHKTGFARPRRYDPFCIRVVMFERNQIFKSRD